MRLQLRCTVLEHVYGLLQTYILGEILAIYASWSRNILIAMKFLRIVLGRCVNKPLIIVDRGPWYKWAIDILGLRYRYQRFSLRSTVERFYNNINTWSIKNNKKHIQINENSRRRITRLTGSYSFQIIDKAGVYIILMNQFMLEEQNLRRQLS